MENNSRETYTFSPQGIGPERIIQPYPANIKLIQVAPVEGEPEMEVRRNETQLEAIERFCEKYEHTVWSIYKGRSNPNDVLAAMFGSSLDWAYRCYSVDVPNNADIRGAPFFQSHIYLFNVLIAFEWEPSVYNISMLERAARRAADFLFDVTDGWMTFGQVIIGGHEFLNCADIQVMASNRLHPRSWVGGLHEPKKYMPIRLGRGMWQKNNPGSIPWDEPEGYRVLVHEWAHYALELLDDYIDTHEVYLRDNTRIKLRPNQGRRSNAILHVSSIDVPHASIMSTLVGTSELTAKKATGSLDRKQAEWDVIIEGFDGLKDVNGLSNRQPRFRRITEQPQPIEGPLPLRELPHIAVLGSSEKAPDWKHELFLPKDSLPSTIKAEHCWVYILKQPNDQRIPERVLAQGTLDSLLDDGFRLFGAERRDHILLIGDNPYWEQKVLRATIDVVEPRADQRSKVVIKPEDWSDVTPRPFPIIDVIPGQATLSEERAVTVRVVLSDPEKNKDYDKDNSAVFVFPYDLMNTSGIDPQDRIELDVDKLELTRVSLDGHILVKIREDDRDSFVIATYSQGGGPPTGSPVGSTPITPGSSEGNLIIFFADQKEYPNENKHHGLVRVVTTRLPGGAKSVLDGGAEARGYAFTVCSNAALPRDYQPTLSLFYDRRTELQDGEAIIHRQDDDGKWLPVASYRPNGAWYVAIPLNYKTAPRLVSPDIDKDTPRVERYRLYLVPPDDSEV